MRRIIILLTLLPPLFIYGAPGGGNDNPEEKAEDDVYRVRKVVIDAGHGGHDHGCSGSFSREKDIALDMALLLGGYIEEYIPDVEVIYTRKTDKFVELHERARIANRSEADLFISIHCNASSRSYPHGTETYVMGLHRSEANLSVAKRENSVILLEDNYNHHYNGFDPNSPTAHIIFSLYQNAFLEQSILFASKIEEQFANRVHRSSRGVKQAGFLVLYKTTMPSVLIETGFLTNKAEERFLHSTQGKEYMASAVFRAFRDYKHTLEGTHNVIVKEGDELEKSIYEGASAGIPDDPEVEEDRQEALPAGEQHAAEEVSSKVPPHATNDSSIIFKIQFYASSMPFAKNEKVRKNMRNEEVSEFFENDLYKYFLGDFANLEEAVVKKTQLAKKGFADAFILAYRGKEKISIQEAVNLLSGTTYK